MENRIYDESNGLWYAKKGDYYLPELALPPEEEKLIGIWGQRHLRYLKEHKQFVYLNLLTSGRLNEYLASVDEQAEDMFFRLVKEYAGKHGVTEQLKAENQLLWVRKIQKFRFAKKSQLLRNPNFLLQILYSRCFLIEKF